MGIWKKVFRYTCRTIGFLLLIVVGLGLIEYGISITNTYKNHIGTADASQHYNADTRTTHIQYLNTFNYQNLNIRYIDQGDREGKVIVLLHGTPTNSWLYRKIIPGLVKKGYRVIAPDMVGFGTSSMPKESYLLSSQQQAKRINALIKHLGIDSFTIAGHDQGSLWMWETITSYPDKIEAIIVFNSIGDWEGFHPLAGFGQVNRGTKLISRAMGSVFFGRLATYGAMLGSIKNYAVITPSMVNGYATPLLNGMNHTYYEFISSFDTIRSDLERYHREIEALQIIPPAMVVRGAHDTILVADEQIPVLQKLLDIQEENIHILEDASHFIQEEQPAHIVYLIDAFMSKYH